MNPNIQQTEKKEIFMLNSQVNNNLLSNPNKEEDNSLDNLSNENKSNDEEGNFKSGRWHPQEHERFIKGCLLYGNNWKKVSLITS